jgi:hypothetical protein
MEAYANRVMSDEREDEDIPIFLRLIAQEGSRLIDKVYELLKSAVNMAGDAEMAVLRAKGGAARARGRRRRTRTAKRARSDSCANSRTRMLSASRR